MYVYIYYVYSLVKNKEKNHQRSSIIMDRFASTHGPNYWILLFGDSESAGGRPEHRATATHRK